MNPPAPPVALLTVAVPLDPPLQEILVCEFNVRESAVGCVIVKSRMVEHPVMLSVTVQVQVPALNPVTEMVPSPVGFPGVQLYE